MGCHGCQWGTNQQYDIKWLLIQPVLGITWPGGRAMFILVNSFFLELVCYRFTVCVEEGPPKRREKSTVIPSIFMKISLSIVLRSHLYIYLSILSYLILSYLLLSYLIYSLSYLILSICFYYLSYLILSYLILLSVYLSIDRSIDLLIYRSSINRSIDLSIYLSIFLSNPIYLILSI